MPSTFPLDRFEHVRHLPQLLHINFDTGNHGLVMAVDANTLFGALSPILEALAIFFLAIDTIASTWWELDRFEHEKSSCCLLRYAGVFLFGKEIFLRSFLGQVGVDGQWLLKHIFLKVDTKNVVALSLVQFFTTLVILVIGKLKSLFFKEKFVHLL